MIDYLFESKYPGGTYSSLILSEKSADALYAYCSSLGISNLVEPTDYHCTLIYSKKECTDIAKEDFSLPCGAIPTGFRILGEETKVLVLEIYCPNATRLHELFMEKYGATHDYDEYIPHITIASDFTGEVPVELPDLDVNIEFTEKVVEELK